MSDVFLSYASEDRDRASRIAQALESQGWSVWWDRRIPAGRTWRTVLEDGLREAGCLVVLWSRVSVESEWVVEEAELGQATKKVIIPVLLETVRVPLQFRSLQSVDLAHWDGDPNDPLFLQLVHAVNSAVGPKTVPREPSEPIVKPGSIFVSYSKEDLQYVRKLIAFLRNSGLSVWADDRIDFGDRWWRTIVANIRGCVAMVVVMTPASEDSKWVEREVLLADKLEKPIFPLLLSGDCFPILITFQYHAVTNGSMPPSSVIATLTNLSRGERAARSVPQQPGRTERDASAEQNSLFSKIVRRVSSIFTAGA